MRRARLAEPSVQRELRGCRRGDDVGWRLQLPCSGQRQEVGVQGWWRALCGTPQRSPGLWDWALPPPHPLGEEWTLGLQSQHCRCAEA